MLLTQRFQLVVIWALFWLGRVYSVANTSVDTGQQHEDVEVTNAELALQLGRIEQLTYQLQGQVYILQLKAEGIRKKFYLAQAQKHSNLANLYTQLATQQAQMVDAMDNRAKIVGSLMTALAKAKQLQMKMEKALCQATPPLGHVYQIASPHGQDQYSLEEAERACRDHGGWLANYSQLIKLQRMESGPYHCGWVEGGTAYYPVWEETASCHGNTCIRMKTCDKGDKHNAWCFQPIGICSRFNK